jgi:CBS domain-containing protein
MTNKVITCSPEDTLATAAKMMSALRIRHLPVTDGNKLVGVIAMRDIMMHRLEAMHHTSRKVGNLVVCKQ